MNDNLKKNIFHCLLEFENNLGDDKQILDDLKKVKKDNLILFHFTLGLHIRNNFLLPHSTLYTLFLQNGILDEDEMSELVLYEWCKILKLKDQKKNLILPSG